ncbi:MAG: hypothetical protein VX185_13930 [Pseudomonadota bacterium]|nr:hypothetical protein [Pseudomonadota bacterium]
MVKLIAFIIGGVINILGVIIILPFSIVGGIFTGLARIGSAERNQQNGADIRALCIELGVPSKAYNQIVINQMDLAKNIANQIGEPGQAHHSSPWNTRLAVAINLLYKERINDSFILDSNPAKDSKPSKEMTEQILSEFKKYPGSYNSSDFYLRYQHTIEDHFPELSRCTGGSSFCDEKTVANAFANANNALVREEFQMAARYYTIASLAGNLDAKYNLALMHINGLFYHKNVAIAFIIFMECAKEGNLRAKYTVGRMLCAGHGVAENEDEGLGWILASRPDESCEKLDWIDERTAFLNSYRESWNFPNKSILFALNNLPEKYSELVNKVKSSLKDEQLIQAFQLISAELGLPLNLIEPYQNYLGLLTRLGHIIEVDPNSVHYALMAENNNEINSKTVSDFHDEDDEDDEDFFKVSTHSSSVSDDIGGIENKINLSNSVTRKYNLRYGHYHEAADDLGVFIALADQDTLDKKVHMAFAYARRYIVAGLYLQGLGHNEDITLAEKMFKVTQAITGHTKEFQIEAHQQALDFLIRYSPVFTPNFLNKAYLLARSGVTFIETGSGVLDFDDLTQLIQE